VKAAQTKVLWDSAPRTGREDPAHWGEHAGHAKSGDSTLKNATSSRGSPEENSRWKGKSTLQKPCPPGGYDRIFPKRGDRGQRMVYNTSNAMFPRLGKQPGSQKKKMGRKRRKRDADNLFLYRYVRKKPGCDAIVKDRHRDLRP